MRVFASCPLCKVDLIPGSQSCPCGWRAQQPEKPKLLKPCCHATCERPALIVLKLKTGWADLCRVHYEEYISREAAEFNKREGLLTREKQRAYLRARLPAIGNTVLERIPGEDDR